MIEIMKLFRYILLVSVLISGNVVAQEKQGSKILVNNQSILIDDNRKVVVAMDITLPGNLEVPTDNYPCVKGQQRNSH